MKIGIVGLPNAGKSSLFNALTRAGAEAANYPFTTIEPNVAVVPVADDRLERIAAVIGSSEVVYVAITRTGGIVGQFELIYPRTRFVVTKESSLDLPAVAIQR